MYVNKKEIRHLIELSMVGRVIRRRLGTRKLKYIQKDLNDFRKNHCAKIAQVDTTGVEPSFYPLFMQNVFREDVVKPSLSAEEALSNAPSKENNYFTVPRII